MGDGNLTRMVMEKIGRRLESAQIWDESGFEDQVSMTQAGSGTAVSGYAKVVSGSSFSQYQTNLNGEKYASDIASATWCAVCPSQCNAITPQVTAECPAITGPIVLSNIKGVGITQETWDNRFGAKPWYSQWWGILLICLAIVLR